MFYEFDNVEESVYWNNIDRLYDQLDDCMDDGYETTEIQEQIDRLMFSC